MSEQRYVIVTTKDGADMRHAAMSYDVQDGRLDLYGLINQHGAYTVATYAPGAWLVVRREPDGIGTVVA